MLVHIAIRHSPSCPHRANPSYKRCRCLRWASYTVPGGKRIRQSTGTRTQEGAIAFARAVEERHAPGAPVVTEPAAPVTVAQAVASYIKDKKAQNLAASTLRKYTRWFEKELVPWCNAHGVHALRDLGINELREWRGSWKGLSPLSSGKKQEAARAFMTYCIASDWLTANPAKKLSRIKVTQTPTLSFTDDELQVILKAADEIPFMHALVLLMRWSGLRIGDAVT